MSALIEVKNLTKEYLTYRRGSSMSEAVKSLFHREKVIVKAVNDISFDIATGEIVGMLGPNGAGKSTTIKMLTGVLTPSSGSVRVLGFDPYKKRTRYVSNIGAMFGQKSQLIWDIPPIDSFAMNKAIYGIKDEDYKKQLDLLTKLLNAQELLTKPTRVLSLGERMKCEFIIALLHNPKVVFLDEPTIGLDVIAKDSIRSFIKEMNEKGVTFILTTHDLGDIESLVNRAIIIDKGIIVFDGSLPTLKKHLGNKKTVSIQSPRPFEASLLREGIRLLEEKGGKLTLEVDIDLLPMNEFISFIGSKMEITDLSITEIQMEQVVRAIYQP